MKTDTDSPFEFRVLLVEDDDNFRPHLARYLRGEGFEIIEANCNSDACALIREGRVSLVLSDWDLRKRNSSPQDPSTGLEIIRTCREVDMLLPVVVMSSAPDFDAYPDSLMAGADGFLKKPFSFASVKEHLLRWMARVKAEKNPFTQLTAGVIERAETVNRAYTRAVVEMVGSALQAAPKLGLSRQTVASYLACPGVSQSPLSFRSPNR